MYANIVEKTIHVMNLKFVDIVLSNVRISIRNNLELFQMKHDKN
jgi:hypothetical protein